MNKYLEKITWRPEESPQALRQYLTNMRLVALVILMLVGGGIFAYQTLPKTVAPEINLTLITVQAVLPGAAPEEVETLLTLPIEKELQGINGIDEYQANSSQSVASFFLTFERGVDENRALADVQAALSRVPELPEDATTPQVQVIDFENAPVVQWVFVSDTLSESGFSQQIKDLVDTLESDSLVKEVVTSGQPDREVAVIVTPEKAQSFGVSIQDVQNAVIQATKSFPAGLIKGETIERSLAISAKVQSVEDLRTLPLSLNEKTLILGDVATIIEHPVPGQYPAVFQVGESRQPSVTLDVYRSTGSDIAVATNRAIELTDEFLANHPEIDRYEITNASTELTTQFADLMQNLVITVILVFIVLMLFVGRRQALLASVSIPLIYSIAFIAMHLTHVSVNFLSLFSLMLSLGLLVDVTIVVVSAMTSYMRESTFRPAEVAALVFHDYLLTLVMTTLTTVWAFVPLLLAGGIIGEYIKPIPVVVSSVLIASIFVGFFVILPLMIWLFDFSLAKRVRTFFLASSAVIITALIVVFFDVKPLASVLVLLLVVLVFWPAKTLVARYRSPKKEKVEGQRDTPQAIIKLTALETKYKQALDSVLRSKEKRRQVLIAVALFFVFSLGLVGGGLVKNEFFPGEDFDIFYAEISFPQGTKGDIVAEESTEILNELTRLNGVEYGTLQVGFQIGEDGSTSRSSANKVLMTLSTPLPEDGGRGAQAVVAEARELESIKNFTAGEINLVERQGGPPAGADVNISFSGENLETLRALAGDLQSRVHDLPIENIKITPEAGVATLKFIPNDAHLAELGITRREIAAQLQLLTYGITLVDDYEFDSEHQSFDIVLRTTAGEGTLDDLGKLIITTPQGTRIPLGELGNFKLEKSTTAIKRTDFERTVTLTASLSEGGNLNDVNKNIGQIIENDIQLPAGYSWTSGGANEENQDSVRSIMSGMILAALLIFLTLIIHLGSYRKAFIVLLTIPPAASGVFVVFGLAGIPLSFPALIGVLALFGIVVNNAIIVIAQVNANREVGMDFHEALVEGAGSRLEPILLSSLTTIIGLVPITISNPLWQGLGGAIIAGLLFSGTIMLFFIPTLYYVMISDEREQDAVLV